MAVITYTQDAVLGAYQQWLMQQGAQACQERIILGQTGPKCGDVAGAIVAQAGSQIRYSVLTTLSSATVFFGGTFQTEAGMFQNVGETVTGTSAGGIQQVLRPATAGCYRTMVASVGSAVVAGQEVYVLAELGRTNNGVFQPYALLVSGYVRSNEPIDTMPGPGTKNTGTSSGGGGCCLSTVSADVFPGTETALFTISVPSGANGRIIYVNGGFTTTGAAANRHVQINIAGTSGWGFLSYATNTQAASKTRGYTWQLGGERYVQGADSDEYMPLPESLWFSSDIIVDLGEDNLQTGDDWTYIDCTWEIKGP